MYSSLIMCIRTKGPGLQEKTCTLETFTEVSLITSVLCPDPLRNSTFALITSAAARPKKAKPKIRIP